MNLQEFAALKVGDKIENHSNGSAGGVVETTDAGVRVVWGAAEPNTANRFFYSANSTAWMHWSKVEPADLDDERHEGDLEDEAARQANT